MQALILAGGLGTRLRSVLPDLPKPLAPIGIKPFMLYILEQLKMFNIREIILCVGYQAKKIEEYFGDGQNFGVNIKYVEEARPLGTGGALRNALPFIKENSTLIFNGDTYFDIDLKTLERFHKKWGANVTIALKYQKEVTRYGIVQLRDNNEDGINDDERLLYQIVSFKEKPNAGVSDGYINGGVYIINKEILESISTTPASLERDYLPYWVQRGAVYGLPFGGNFIDIGIPDDYSLAQERMEEWTKSLKYPGVFLDRDGVINEDKGYLWRNKDIRFIPRTIKIIRSANQIGQKIVVVTNQSGVARGYYQENDVEKLHKWMKQELERMGAYIDYFFYCPHHPEGTLMEYRKQCLCRKPKPGMILQAAQLLNIEVQRSVMIGDKESDRIMLPYLKSIII